MNKNEIVAVIDAYAEKNGIKNAVTKEVGELGKAIKAYFNDRGLTILETPNNTAAVSYRKTKTLDQEKLAAHFGGTIPEKFYTEKEMPTLTVKSRKAAAAVINAIKSA